MEYVDRTDPRPEPISIARCRELLGEDVESVTDQDIEDIRRHAETMAFIVVEMYQEQCRVSEWHFVVVFDLTRFARDKYDHFALRSHLQSLGISLRSATEPIDDTSTGKLMEGVLAAFAQFDNDLRLDRTRAGMKAGLELGRWVFLAPIGYLNGPRWIGRSFIHDPERAPLVRRAFDDYASGRFTKEQLLKHVRT